MKGKNHLNQTSMTLGSKCEFFQEGIFVLLGFACSMLGKSSKNLLPNGCFMVMNPMILCVKKSPSVKAKCFKIHGD